MTLVIFCAAAVVLHLVAAIFVTRRLWRAHDYDRTQKIAQTWIIRCVPVVGMMLVLSLLQPRRQHAGGDDEDDDDDDDDDDDGAPQDDAPHDVTVATPGLH